MTFAQAMLLGVASAFVMPKNSVQPKAPGVWDLLQPWKWASSTLSQEQHELDASFNAWAEFYGKSFGTKEEFEMRKTLFAEVNEKIEAWNADETKTHTIAHNKFSAMTAQERKQLTGFLGIDQKNKAGEYPVKKGEVVILNATDLPTSVDWRQTDGVVQPVQNQGTCGSCWAFSAIGAMEGAHAIATKQSVKLSEQQCVDCVEMDQGCNGGWQADCMDYARFDNMVPEAEYPYHAITDECFVKYDGKVKVSKVNNVLKESKAQLMAAIAEKPVSVTIEADQYPFQHYFSGIITDATCGTSLDHAVLAVGYGNENGTDYYIVKNSWGADWGEKGYVRIAAVDGKGICGIQQVSVYPDTN